MPATHSIQALENWLQEVSQQIDKSDNIHPPYFSDFLHDPDLGLYLVSLIANFDEKAVEANRNDYSACIFAMDICVAQLQTASEGGSKPATKGLNQLMAAIAQAILKGKQSLSFWLPVLNAFYEVNAELSSELQNAYFSLANEESEYSPEEEVSHINAIRDLILELSDLSVFDIAENFFAQSYAMPPAFFADLIIDLYSIEEGEEIALLMLLHPKQVVREVAIAVHEELMDKIILSATSLSRLQAIKQWFAPVYQEQINRWIKLQRKKGGIFKVAERPVHHPIVHLDASEVDGSGAQGVFIHLRQGKQNRLCGLLLKYEVGIKDAWITPSITPAEIEKYYGEAFDESLVLRPIDVEYLQLITNHFLAVSVEKGEMPDLHLLEIQETLGVQWVPKKIDLNSLLEQLAIEIHPFTPERILQAFSRSKSWSKTKAYTESWYVENPAIDKLVNRNCHFKDGIKLCRFEEAKAAVFAHELEKHRERWSFHFLWVALWLKAKARKNEKMWEDAFIIAYAIHTGTALSDIPIMQEICYQSIVNSIETMEERKTHLN